jgi:hypothetical protein
VIFVASKESVMNPGSETKIHFDIHQSVQFFGNHDELSKRVREVIERNREALFRPVHEEYSLDLTQVNQSWQVMAPGLTFTLGKH